MGPPRESTYLLPDLSLLLRGKIVYNVEAAGAMNDARYEGRKEVEQVSCQSSKVGLQGTGKTHSLRISSGCFPLIILATVLHPTSLQTPESGQEEDSGATGTAFGG